MIIQSLDKISRLITNKKGQKKRKKKVCWSQVNSTQITTAG